MSTQQLIGSCLCGEVCVTLTSEPLMVAACHCTHCQKTAGSAFSTVLLMPVAAASVQGRLIGYDDRGDSGMAVRRSFCGRCGSPIETASQATQAQQVRIIKSGLFAGLREFVPTVELFCASRCSWVPALPGTTAFGGMPPH